MWLQDSDTHHQIVEELQQKMEKGFDVNTSLDRVLPKHKAEFEGLFLQEDSEEEEASSEDQ